MIVLPITTLLLCASLANADEAIDPAGKTHAGQLVHEKAGWQFSTVVGKQIALDRLAFVRFAARPIPNPKVPLHIVLLLPNEQRVTGTLLAADSKKIVFATSWGKILTLPRGAVVGIEQANDSLTIVRDDFEAELKDWQLLGKPKLNGEQAFFGKGSLFFESAGQEASRTLKTGLRAGAIRFFFFDPDAKARWRCNVLSDKAKPPPAFVIEPAGFTCVNVTQPFAARKATSGWHMLVIEIADERLRIFVDDFCVGQSTLSENDAIVGVRCRVDSGQDVGKLWIDEFSVSRRLTPVPRPKASAEQDSIWLEHGEQLFGRLVSADRDRVVLDAKFGQRAYSWSRVRGILFAQTEAAREAVNPEITFRPASGFALDRVRGKLIRWEKDHLLIEHPFLGEIPIERDRLDKVRPMSK